MTDALAGIKVLEVAAWTFVPAAGAVLAEWGADVIKVEHPVGGDPQRGLITSGLVPAGKGGVNYMIEVPNRGKRSIGIDLSTEGGRDILLKLAAESDVFRAGAPTTSRRYARTVISSAREAIDRPTAKHPRQTTAVTLPLPAHLIPLGCVAF